MSTYQDDKHATTVVPVQEAPIDDLAIELVQKLNKFPFISTQFCCQGSPMGTQGRESVNAYVLFTAITQAAAYDALKALEAARDALDPSVFGDKFLRRYRVEVNIYEGHLRYNARFANTEMMVAIGKALKVPQW